MVKAWQNIRPEIMGFVGVKPVQFEKKVEVQDYVPPPMSKQADIEAYSRDDRAGREVIRVGPQEAVKAPSQAARIAKDGMVVEIAAGEYRGDVAVWRADDLVLRGVGGRARVDAAGKSAENKAIWVIKGENTRVENIEFSNCAVPDKNGAGIRLEGSSLQVKNCVFHHNQNGILAGGPSSSGVVQVEHSEFAHNGHGDGQSHGLYIGRRDKLIFQFNYVHHTRVGHQVKSRARENIIRYNKLMDGRSGNSSYTLDLPNAGSGLIVGNVIQQGPQAENWAMINFGGKAQSVEGVIVAGNTVVNDRSSGIFVKNNSPLQASIMNNLMVGRLEVCKGAALEKGNMRGKKRFFRAPGDFDYHLQQGTDPVDSGIAAPSILNPNLKAKYEYAHPISRKARKMDEHLDVGAFEL